jgi:hypothetical protein
MTERSFQFEKLAIKRVEKRMREGNGFELDDVSSGVNLVYGPNGSAKSTTALVIQELLWPARTGMERPSIVGWCREGAKRWYIGIDAGDVECTCDGIACSAPTIGPPEHRRRYLLAIDELISSSDLDFAKLITNASQGGYDLSAASNSLGFQSKPKRCNTERSSLQQAFNILEKARQHQREIDGEASNLESLRTDLKKAIDAAENVHLLNKALEYRTADEDWRRITQQLEALPAGISELRGDERDTLDEIASRRRQCEADLASERDRITDATATLRELHLPPNGVSKLVLDSLRTAHRQLSSIESEIQQLSQRAITAEAEATKCRNRLGSQISEDQLSTFEQIEVPGLSEFARQTERVQAQRAMVHERRAWLKPKESEKVPPYTTEQIWSGLSSLGGWLNSPPPPARNTHKLHWGTILAAIIASAFAIALSIVHHWAWLLGILAPIAVVAASALLRRRIAEESDYSRSVYQGDFERTNLPQPVSWDVAAVVASMRNLAQLAASRAREDDRLRRLEDVDQEEASCKERITELTTQYRDLKRRLGLEITVGGEWLSILVDNIGRWQKCTDESTSLKSTLANLEQERDRLLVKIDAALSPFGYLNVDSSANAQTYIDDLADKRSQFDKAKVEMTDAQRRIDESITPGIEDADRKRQAILNRVGITDAEESIVDDWLSKHPAYLELKEQLAAAEAIRTDRKQTLADHQSLLELTSAEIQLRLDEERRIAQQRDQLSNRIGEINQAINDAKRGHEVSSALEGYTEAKANLSDAREANSCAIVGAMLTDWVRQVAIGRSRPQVFRRANELFVKFTKGLLHLCLDDISDPPRFMAQFGDEPARPVGELSLGERAQLLMAVRIAFLEQDESIQLPLLLDEAFGTSDDIRTSLIVDTVVEIARQGRQVFYFTARRDEICKWVNQLQTSDVPHKVIDLAEVRRISVAEAVPLPPPSIEFSTVPSPDGMDYESYGRVLHVPGPDPSAQTQDNVHLWHLFHDPLELHECASQGIVAWGQLRALKRFSADGSAIGSKGVYERAAVAAKAVEAACEAWRVGRGKPVDRRVLQDSQCVSKAFINELSDLARAENGDAGAIITALEIGKVARWRSNNTQALREYFETSGYLTEEAPLSSNEVRARVVTAVADDVNAGRIDLKSIDRIIASLPQQCDSDSTHIDAN